MNIGGDTAYINGRTSFVSVDVKHHVYFFFTYRVGCLFSSITTDSLTHLTVRKE